MPTIESPIPTDPEDLNWFLELLAGLRQRFPDPGQAADLLGQLLERGLDQKDKRLADMRLRRLSRWLAYMSRIEAQQRNPAIRTDGQAYEFLRQRGSEVYDGRQMEYPKMQSTWQKTLSLARGELDEKLRAPRIRGESRSVVRPRDVA